MMTEQKMAQNRLRAARMFHIKNKFTLHLRRYDYWLSKAKMVDSALSRQACMDKALQFLHLAEEANDMLYNITVGEFEK